MNEESQIDISNWDEIEQEEDRILNGALMPRFYLKGKIKSD